MQAILNNNPGELPDCRYVNSAQDYADAGFPERAADPLPEGTKFTLTDEAFDALLGDAEGDTRRLRVSATGNGIEVHMPSAADVLDDARTQKLAALKMLREAKEYGTFEHAGTRWNCDLASSTKIKAAPDDIEKGDLELPLTWITYDNQFHNFQTHAEVREWSAALTRHVSDVYRLYGGHYLQLQAHPDPVNYDITAGW